MANPTEREDLLAALHQAMRSFTNQVTFYSEAVAATVGIHPTDLDCLSVIGLEGSVSPGRLADVTGLTSGAVTGVLDRLERAGYVRRTADPTDRRRVVVEPVADALGPVSAAFLPMIAATSAMAARYDDTALATITDYVTRSTPMLNEETLRLRAGTAPNDAVDAVDDIALRGAGMRDATIRFLNGAARLTVRAAVNHPQLFTAQFRGGRPTTREDGDTVTVQYRRSPFAHFRTSGEISIDADRRWSIDIGGGFAHSSFDLRETIVDEVTVKGGIASVDLDLPRPQGTTKVEIRGGVHAVTISRPPGVPAILSIKGGAANIVLDDQVLRAVGGGAELRSDQADGEDRLEVVVRGGASSLSVITRSHS